MNGSDIGRSVIIIQRRIHRVTRRCSGSNPTNRAPSALAPPPSPFPRSQISAPSPLHRNNSMRSTSPSPLLDFSSKGLYNVQPNEPSIESPWRQGGRCVEVLSGVGELRVREEWPINGKRRSVRDAEGGLVGDGNHLERSGSAGGQGSEDGLPVYYEVLISPDRDGKPNPTPPFPSQHA